MRSRSEPVRLLLLAVLLAALAALGATAAGAPGDPADATGSARVSGYGAILPDGNRVSAGATSGAAEAGHADGPVGGPSASAQAAVDVGASARGRDGSADGTVVLSGVSLLGGRVTAASVRMSVTAEAGPGGTQAGISDVRATGLTVDGAPVSAAPGTRVEIAGVGTLVMFEQAVSGTGVRANALRLEVTQPGGPVSPGATVVLGHIDASAEAGEPAAGPDRTAPSTPERPSRRGTAPAPAGTTRTAAPPPAPAPAADPRPPALPSPPPALGLPRQEAPLVPMPGGGYAFPLYGDAAYGDDYGAPRPVTGWHHGTDLFAPTGTPVLAVAEGTLSKVGVNALGGNRLWLTDDAGNQFYYAHLSAYSPEAVEGARVRAGQVIGFVGNTGQAITTPPHLHFEIHPAGGDSVNPHPYLVAWENGTDIPRAFIAAAYSTGAAPAAGATLVGIERAVDEPPAPADGLATPVR